MKVKIRLGSILVFLLAWNVTSAQSNVTYKDLETKFKKPILTADDTTDFVVSANQKIEKFLTYSKTLADKSTSKETKQKLVKLMMREVDTSKAIYFKGKELEMNSSNLGMVMKEVGVYLSKNKNINVKDEQANGTDLGKLSFSNAFSIQRSLIRIRKKFGRKNMDIWVPAIGEIRFN